MPHDFKPRLYVLPWGLFPRRVTIYLKEKKLSDKVEIIPVSVGPTGLIRAPGQPTGTVPILEVEPGVFIRQSTAILEYFEDMFPQEPDMRGDTPLAKAHSRELMDIANEITSVLSMFAREASELFAPMIKQSPVTATTILNRLRQLVGQLEDMAGKDGPFLIQGRGQKPSIVDCIVLSTWQFADHVHEMDIFEGHDRLQAFVKAMLGRDSAERESAPDFILEKSRSMSVK